MTEGVTIVAATAETSTAHRLRAPLIESMFARPGPDSPRYWSAMSRATCVALICLAAACTAGATRGAEEYDRGMQDMRAGLDLATLEDAHQGMMDDDEADDGEHLGRLEDDLHKLEHHLDAMELEMECMRHHR